MNDYVFYFLLLLGCVPLYFGWVYFFIGKDSIVFKISGYFFPSLFLLCYTSFVYSRHVDAYWMFVPCLFSLFFTFSFLSSKIKRPIQDIEHSIQVISQGSLDTSSIDKWKGRKDEFGKISENLILMNQMLMKVVGATNDISEELDRYSHVLDNGASDLSDGAVEQAASTEEISSSIEEMSATTQQNLENAKSVEKIALDSVEQIEKVYESTNQTQEAMKIIDARISVINEIADQTNILALNASVEAARAGQEGKGFSVVAAEVKKLAELSKEAANEIGSLSHINVKLSVDANAKLSNTVPEISRISELLQEIVASSIEQTTGTEMVNTSMQILNNVTQKNAHSSQQISLNAKSIRKSSALLLESISFFSGAKKI